MDLYFSPLACSLATRIALYEAGAAANYLEVDPKTKLVQNDGSDFFQLNPLGLVPTLSTERRRRRSSSRNGPTSNPVTSKCGRGPASAKRWPRSPCCTRLN